MGKERAAVLGVGQTKYDTTYPGSMAGMLREAATNALEMSGKGWDDIDAVIMGKAPDFFEGVMMPEVYLAEALGCVGKPIMRVHTAGSVGGSTACVATSMIQSGVHETVLTIGGRSSRSPTRCGRSRCLSRLPRRSTPAPVAISVRSSVAT